MPNEWQTVLDEIESNVSSMAFKSFFNDFTLVSNEDGDVKVGVSNPFAKTQIESKFVDIVKDALSKINIECKNLDIVIKSNSESSNLVKKRGAIEVTADNVPVIASASTNFGGDNKSKFQKMPSINSVKTYGGKKKFAATSTGLNERYTLDNYIIGSNNDLAVSAARAIIERPGEVYNPLFIYGGSGLGKTHLVQAIGNEITQKHPELTVLYITIEEFYNDFVNAMRFKISGFEEKYRNVDVLIVDDFQFIENKDKSQDEFFHTFNHLYQNNKQVIVCSDRLPDQIAKVDARLSSRLIMGMPIDIQMPDYETRSAIVLTKAAQKGYDLDPKTVEFLASSVRTNIRELEGKLNNLLALADLKGVAPYELIESDMIGGAAAIGRKKAITPKIIIDKVAKYYGLEASDLLGTSRIKNIKTARQIAMLLISDELKYSTTKTGQEFKKDHTTIMHGIKVIRDDMKADFKLREDINELREKIYE